MNREQASDVWNKATVYIRFRVWFLWWIWRALHQFTETVLPYTVTWTCRLQPSICEGVEFPCNRSHLENITDHQSFLLWETLQLFNSPFARFTSTLKALSNTNTNSHCCGDKSPKQQPIKPTVSQGNPAAIATNYSKQEMFGFYNQFEYFGDWSQFCFGDPLVVNIWELWSCVPVSCCLWSDRKLGFQLLLLQYIHVFSAVHHADMLSFCRIC